MTIGELARTTGCGIETIRYYEREGLLPKPGRTRGNFRPHGPQIANHGVVLGRIEWDDDRGGRVPLLVIDGREIDWDEFGRMLMSFEGSQFKLHIADKSEEL